MDDKVMTGDMVVSVAEASWGRSANDKVIYGRGYAATAAKPLQNRQELVSFVDDLLKLDPSRRKLAMEIGIADGGTHVIWKALYDRVISLDISEASIRKFIGGLPNPEQSSFVCGNSTLPGTRVVVASKVLPGEPSLDLLFIDGDHNYNSVEADYLNFEPFVKTGGIIAFHDSKSGGPFDFTNQLEAGITALGLDPIKMVHYRIQFGISYYVKE